MTKRTTSLLACSLVCLVGVWALTACAGRRTSTSVTDQSFVQKPAPAAEVPPSVQEARVTSPAQLPPEPSKPEPPQVEPSPTTVPEPVMPLPTAPGPVERPAVAPLPAPPQEARVAEPAIVPPPVPRAPLPPSVPAANLVDVYFDFDQFAIRTDATSALESDARLLRDKGQTVLIEGHCDERGTMAYNLVLGERRAKAARQYLQDLGVSPSRLQITSYGKERPFCTEHSEACWQSNRRAHFVER